MRLSPYGRACADQGDGRGCSQHESWRQTAHYFTAVARVHRPRPGALPCKTKEEGYPCEGRWLSACQPFRAQWLRSFHPSGCPLRMNYWENVILDGYLKLSHKLDSCWKWREIVDTTKNVLSSRSLKLALKKQFPTHNCHWSSVMFSWRTVEAQKSPAIFSSLYL